MAIRKDFLLKKFEELVDKYGPEAVNEQIDQVSQALLNQHLDSEIIITAICKSFNVKRSGIIRENKLCTKYRKGIESDAFFYCIWLFFKNKSFSRDEISQTLKLTKSDWNNFYNKQKALNPETLNIKIPAHLQLHNMLQEALKYIEQNSNK